MSRLIDSDSEESVEMVPCPACDGSGGYDASADCEVYDDWQTCPECEGSGEVELS